MYRYTFKFLLKSILKHKILFFGALFCVLIIKGLQTLIPILLGGFIDSLEKTESVKFFSFISLSEINLSETHQWIVFFAIAFTIIAVLTPLQTFILSKFVQGSILESSNEWLKTLFKKEFSYFSSVSVGKLVKAMDRGIISHEKILHFSCLSLFPILIEMILCVVAIFQINGSLLAYIILPLFFQTFLSYILIKKRRVDVDKVNESEDRLAGQVTELITNGMVIKLERAIPYAVRRIYQYFLSYMNSAIKLSVSGSILGSIHLGFGHFTTWICMIYGAGLFSNEFSKALITSGSLVALFSLTGRLASVVSDSLEVFRYFDQFEIDISEFLRMQSEDEFERTGKDPFFPKKITILPKMFHRDNAKFLISSKISFLGKEKVAIIGPTGGGKTTFLELLAGLNPISRSSILVDDIPLTELSSNAQLEMIRYCPQGNHLISGQLNESVYFSKEPLTSEMIGTLQSLHLNETFTRPDRYVQERGTNISGGEARRLSISRLLLNPGAIVLFDEPTSSLNEKVKQTIWDLMFSRFHQNLFICTTHDYSYLAHFDRIIFIENGEIKLDAPPDVVLQSDAFHQLRFHQKIQEELLPISIENKDSLS